jgi:hypothetical protein
MQQSNTLSPPMDMRIRRHCASKSNRCSKTRPSSMRESNLINVPLAAGSAFHSAHLHLGFGFQLSEELL